MKTGLYSKIMLIFVLFIIIVMTFSGVILLHNVNSYYTNEFYNQLNSVFHTSSRLTSDINVAMISDNFAEDVKSVLASYSGAMGIDEYRNYYILDKNGTYIDGSDPELGSSLEKTQNLIAAVNDESGTKQYSGYTFADYALSFKNGDKRMIVYVKDTMEEMQNFIWILFSIVLQAIFIGLIFAVLLAFFLSKAIASPISNITESAKRLREGDFEHDIDVHSDDEIGQLSTTFNEMKASLKKNIDNASNERSKLETVFAYLRDAVIAFTDDGRVLHINKSAIKLFGEAYNNSFSINSFMSLLNLDGSSDDDTDSSAPRIEPLVESDIIFNGKVLDINFGNIKYIENNVSHNGIIAVIHDITGRYELEKARREFVANVSHEMRTPLTSIRGACETIQLNSDSIPSEIKKRLLEMAVAECDRMTNIVSDLLTLSRLDDKRTRWKISSYSISESLKHITDVIRVDAQAHGHNLSLDIEDNLPMLQADKERVEQVLINILSNSVKYTPDGGVISVSAENIDSAYVKINVKDNGIGIPAEDLPHIFERFYRVEKSRTSEKGGTGLGLAIAQEIINAHGGTIKIESELNKGTSVTITLPFITSLKNSEV